jgi:surfactin synthase thioesterase subunit
VGELPGTIEPRCLELPGRGRRWREPPVAAVEDALTDLMRQVDGMHGRFAVLGHSMGAYLGLGLVTLLESTLDTECILLVASGNMGPSAAQPLFGVEARTLGDEDVLRGAARFAPLSPEVVGDPTLRERLIRLLRADFGVCDSFVRTMRDTVIRSRILACSGEDDVFTDAQVEAWRDSSSGVTEVRWIPGGHFFVQSHARRVGEVIADAVGRLTPMATTHRSHRKTPRDKESWN